MTPYTLATLPSQLLQLLLQSHQVSNSEEILKASLLERQLARDEATHASLFAEVLTPVRPQLQEEIQPIRWATDAYLSYGDGYEFGAPLTDVSVIVPRSEKAKEEQKRRTKNKAEVFTPSWVCNLQNNLIDDERVGEATFNRLSEDSKTWTPTERVVFTKDFTWQKYVTDAVLEACCGEAPYLCSPYDTVTGASIPLRDEEGRFARIGLLDRKLRVVTENAPIALWKRAALLALSSTYGYEWQGDSLLLARLNMLNTYRDYFEDALGEEPSLEELQEAASIISYNLWQMDGLKMVVPLTCSENCPACSLKVYAGHDGRKTVLRSLTASGYETRLFEELFPLDSYKKRS